MTTLADLTTPALVVDLDVLEANLERMARRAQDLGVALRPHIKTHKCVEIARRQQALGARGITVSTLYEASVFADHGFEDTTWAFPLIVNRIPEAIALARRIRLGLVVDSADSVRALQETGVPLHVWLKVDCGYHRAGVDPKSPYAMRVAAAIANAATLQFEGILSHSGHAYHGPDGDAVAAAAEEERAVMTAFASRLQDEGIEVPGISVGSTPAMMAARNLEGVSEARPGNYALFDYSQVALGSCTPRDCAATVLSSVVSSQPGARHCIIDAGALALSKDTGPPPPHGPTMGEIFEDYAAGALHPGVRIVSVSQEHGRLNTSLPVGSRVRILPNHSCLTVANFNAAYVTRGNEVVDQWKIFSGR